jgi:type III secretion protein L
MVQLVELRPEAAALVGPGRVIPAELAMQLVALDRLHQEAEQRAASLVREAQEQADAIRAAAHADGLAAATEEIQDRLFEIAEASLSMVSRSEEGIVDLALQIAQRIIGAMPADDVARRVATRSLQLATHSSSIRLRVAPASVASVRDQLDAILPPALSGSAVEVIGDARITDPGCVLETDAGLIDATIESQIGAIRRGLQRSLARQNPQAD